MQRKVFGVTALMLAAANHQVDIVQILVEAGAQVNAKMTTAVQRWRRQKVMLTSCKFS